MLRLFDDDSGIASVIARIAVVRWCVRVAQPICANVLDELVDAFDGMFDFLEVCLK